MFSFAEVFFSRGGHTEVKINTLYNAKRERSFSVRPRAALPLLFLINGCFLYVSHRCIMTNKKTLKTILIVLLKYYLKKYFSIFFEKTIKILKLYGIIK